MEVELYEEMSTMGDVANRYLKIHNNLFSSPRGLFGKLRKIFKPMNFGEYVSELELLESELEKSNQRLKKISYSDDLNKLHRDELINLNITYKNVIDSLKDLCLGLEKKSKNESYSMSDYQSDLELYNLNVQEYRYREQILFQMLSESN